MRLTEAYMALGIVNEAQTAAAVLGHNFPDSPWYKDAYRAGARRRAGAAREPGLLDQPGLQEGRAGLSRRPQSPLVVPGRVPGIQLILQRSWLDIALRRVDVRRRG